MPMEIRKTISGGCLETPKGGVWFVVDDPSRVVSRGEVGGRSRRRNKTYLFRQMINADDDGDAESPFSPAAPFAALFFLLLLGLDILTVSCV